MHTSFSKGTPVLITFKDGRKIIDKFKDKKSGIVIFDEVGSIKTKELRNITIFKGDKTKWENTDEQE